MAQPDRQFKEAVYDLVAQIPEGRAMTYGDVALYSGHPYAARIVGQIAHFGPSDLPWHRVVNRFGGLASGYYGGKEGHKTMLEAEGIKVEDYQIVNFESIRWHPK